MSDDGDDSGDYESPDEIGPEELEMEMFHYVVKHVIDLKDEDMFQAFIENIPNIMALKFFSPEEFKELWLKKDLKKIPILIKMNIRAWKTWLMKNPENLVNEKSGRRTQVRQKDLTQGTHRSRTRAERVKPHEPEFERG
jgi:hypothetical protein